MNPRRARFGLWAAGRLWWLQDRVFARLWVRLTAVFGFIGYALFQLLAELIESGTAWWEEMRIMWPLFWGTFKRGKR